MDFSSLAFWISILQIIWIDLLLSGDNAVVIGMAVRNLPAGQRRSAIWLGSGAAVVLRILFATIISLLLNIPLLKVLGAILLLWIAIKLVNGEEEDASGIRSGSNLWKAVWTIVVADAVMSLDNVVAIAAAARGHYELFVFGLLVSIPLVVFGATLISGALKRWPVIVWAGGALLGWVAGGMFIGDSFLLSAVQSRFPELVTVDPHSSGDIAAIGAIRHGAAAIGALCVLVVGMLLVRGRRH